MTSNTNQKKKKWPFIICVLLILAAIAALIIGLNNKENETAPENEIDTENEIEAENETEAEIDTPTPDIAEPEIVPESFNEINLGSDIIVTDVSAYTGKFVEDGSDELVSGIPVATVENKGSEEIQLLRFALSDEAGQTYSFELTTLLPGARMTVLEKERKPLDTSAKITSGKVEGCAVFEETPSLHPDHLMLLCQENSITVRNVGEENLPTGRVFYKNVMDELLIGGITYMVSFPELAPDEEITLTPTHFNDDSSRIMFVTYAE